MFYFLTYEGSVDIDSLTDEGINASPNVSVTKTLAPTNREGERRATEAQINNFGQTPVQVRPTNDCTALRFDRVTADRVAAAQAASAAPLARRDRRPSMIDARLLPCVLMNERVTGRNRSAQTQYQRPLSRASLASLSSRFKYNMMALVCCCCFFLSATNDCAFVP